MIKLETLINNNPRLPSPPVIAIRILEAVKKDDFSFSELARIIATDPALTAKILRVANSAFYSMPDKVTSIEKALSILGVVLLKNLALSFVITRDLMGPAIGDFNFPLFWRRAITAAVGAELVNARTDRRNEEAFVSAILQDIGIIIMYFSRPEDYLKVLDEKRASGLSVDKAEQKIFGFDHQELGSELLKLWGLPEEIYLPIRYHHEPAEAPEAYESRAALLKVSDKIAGVYHGMHSVEKLKDIKEWQQSRFGISESDTETMIDAVAQRSVEIFSSFEIEPGEMKPFSQILQEANDELSRLNLSYEQLVMEYKQAKDGAERLAHELKEANERLRELALRDGLTGLYNHRYFQELIEEELAKAFRDGYPLSLAMFDIDHFKKINDSFGHPRGDAVLKAISATVESVIRPIDYAARYGGEEFALVLPKSGLSEATALAENLRASIEKLQIVAAGRTIQATISIGVTACLPTTGHIDKAHLIAAVDAALYESKHNGRNRVTVAR